MAARAKKIRIHDLYLTGDARRGYSYFVIGSAEDGYSWQLVAPDDTLLCSSPVFANKKDCLKTLRAVQRHGASTHVLDHADE